MFFFFKKSDNSTFFWLFSHLNITKHPIKRVFSTHQLPSPLLIRGNRSLFAPNWARSAIFLTNLCASLVEGSIGKGEDLSYRKKVAEFICHRTTCFYKQSFLLNTLQMCISIKIDTYLYFLPSLIHLWCLIIIGE